MAPKEEPWKKLARALLDCIKHDEEIQGMLPEDPDEAHDMMEEALVDIAYRVDEALA